MRLGISRLTATAGVSIAIVLSVLAVGLGGVVAPSQAEAASVSWGWNSVSVKFSRAETRCLATMRCYSSVMSHYPLNMVRAAAGVRAYWALQYPCNLSINVSYSDPGNLGWGRWNCG